MSIDESHSATDATASPRERFLPKWPLLLGFWLLQASVMYALWPVLIISGDQGRSTTHDFLKDWGEALTSIDYLIWGGIVLGVLTLLQLIFVLPVRRPQPLSRSHGIPVKVSLTIAALCGAVLALGLSLALIDLYWLIVRAPSAPERSSNDLWNSGVFGVAISSTLALWAVATPLLWAFCKPTWRETLLGRVARRLFIGTLVEAAAIIPLDVMIRRKSDCYCGQGTFWALTLCAGVGMVMLGPVICLPLLVKRRKRNYAGLCEACGYDLRGLAGVERCPECGAGWRAQ